MDDGLRMVQSRACGAWTLPGDPTCAGVARRLFRMVASGLALEPETIDDGVTMVSELAANTLHAQQGQPAPANPELWLYLRGCGPRVELVCKVFDTIPGWVRGHAPGRTIVRAPADAMSGRGLEVVHALSAGRWGHHLSRARLVGRNGANKPPVSVVFQIPGEQLLLQFARNQLVRVQRLVPLVKILDRRIQRSGRVWQSHIQIRGVHHFAHLLLIPRRPLRKNIRVMVIARVLHSHRLENVFL